MAERIISERIQTLSARYKQERATTKTLFCCENQAHSGRWLWTLTSGGCSRAWRRRWRSSGQTLRLRRRRVKNPGITDWRDHEKTSVNWKCVCEREREWVSECEHKGTQSWTHTECVSLKILYNLQHFHLCSFISSLLSSSPSHRHARRLRGRGRPFPVPFPPIHTAQVSQVLPTSQEAHPPEARVQRRLDMDALVERRDGALLQVEPVVGADGQSQQPQTADGEDAGQQSQGLPAAGAHDHSRRRRRPWEGREKARQGNVTIQPHQFRWQGIRLQAWVELITHNYFIVSVLKTLLVLDMSMSSDYRI